MTANRRIIHLDLDAFYCAVEEQRNPALRGQPFAVGGRPEARGVVSSCSYAARARGVRSAMPMRTALSLCPELEIISPHFPAYRAASQQVMERLRALTPLVEQISIDEAFLDVSDLSQPAEVLGRGLQEGIRVDLGLPCSLGIAGNKLVAKIATEVGKHNAPKGMPPNALTVALPGQEAEFLAPLPVEMLWGVGPKTAAKLAELGIHTIGELTQLPEIELARRFGKNGYELALHAQGIDNRPVVCEHEARSISQEVTFARDLRDREQLCQVLQEQAQRVARQLHQQGLKARTVKIKLRWPDFTTLTRQITLPQPTDEGEIVAAKAIELFEKTWLAAGKIPVRLIGVGVSGFESTPRQIGLWDRDWQKDEKLRQAIEELQDRFGEQAITRGDPWRPEP